MVAEIFAGDSRLQVIPRGPAVDHETVNRRGILGIVMKNMESDGRGELCRIGLHEDIHSDEP
mgnify:CR=1 FL=1